MLTISHTQCLYQGVTNIVQFQISRSTLNDRMYLCDTPRDTMAKYMMLQSLWSTPTWNAPELMPNIFKLYFSCVPKLYAQQKCNYSCAPEPFAQHKTSHRSCASRSMPNTNISSIMCFRVHAQHKTYIYLYIINNWHTPDIQNKSSCSYVVGSSTQYI